MKRGHYLVIIGLLFCIAWIFILDVTKRKAEENRAQSNTELSFIGETDKDNREETNSLYADSNLDPEDRKIGIQSYHSEQEREDRRKWYNISRHGADAKITFHVTDSEGKNVSEASFHTGFIFNETSFTVVEGETDKNGVFVAEGKTSYDVNYVVQKDGYYKTSSTLYFSKRGGNDVIAGKWQPWNPTVRVKLKEIRKPTPMYMKRAEVFLPQKGEPFGYDFEKGDLVAPHGKGEQTYLLLMCTFEDRGTPFSLDYKTEFFITMPQQMGGVIVNAKDMENRFVYRHEAQEHDYQPEFYLITDRTQSKILKSIELPKTEYLTFQSRVVQDENGKIISAHYGKIDNIEYGRNVKNPEGSAVFFTYYFNPTPNDRNLEYDGSNLFGRRR